MGDLIINLEKEYFEINIRNFPMCKKINIRKLR